MKVFGFSHLTVSVIYRLWVGKQQAKLCVIIYPLAD